MNLNEGIRKQLKRIELQCKTIKPLVVIQCIAYNHEHYIQDALEGFVMQKTNFPFVAIVHDDASKDNTAETIKEFADKYPDIILPIYETENQYSKKDGSLTIIVNKACEVTGAKYIAMCEGDDYWTDPLKLQKQVDFLNNNPDYVMCFHNATVIINERYNKRFNGLERDCDLGYRDSVSKWLVPTASIVIRDDVLQKIPSEIAHIYSGDYRLILACHLQGKIRYLKDIMSIYRFNQEGNSISIRFLKDPIFVKDQQILLLNSIYPLAEGKLKKYIKSQIRRLEKEKKLISIIEGKNYIKILSTLDLILKKSIKKVSSWIKYGNNKPFSY